MKYQYQTNINCGGCVAKVTPYMDQEPRIKAWSVDTDNPKKILTVEGQDLSSEEVMALVQEAGFEIKPKKKGLFRR